MASQTRRSRSFNFLVRHDGFANTTVTKICVYSPRWLRSHDGHEVSISREFRVPVAPPPFVVNAHAPRWLRHHDGHEISIFWCATMASPTRRSRRFASIHHDGFAHTTATKFPYLVSFRVPVAPPPFVVNAHAPRWVRHHDGHEISTLVRFVILAQSAFIAQRSLTTMASPTRRSRRLRLFTTMASLTRRPRSFHSRNVRDTGPVAFCPTFAHHDGFANTTVTKFPRSRPS